MTWNLHIVGHAVEDGVQKAFGDFVDALTKAGHVVESAVLTTDNGQTALKPIVADAEKAVEDVVPEATPVIDEANKIVEDPSALKADAEKLVEDLGQSSVPTTGGDSSVATTQSDPTPPTS